MRTNIIQVTRRVAKKALEKKINILLKEKEVVVIIFLIWHWYAF
jgi:hypothetical protein